MTKKRITLTIITILTILFVFNVTYAADQTLNFTMGGCGKAGKRIMCTGRLTNNTTRNVLITNLTVTLYKTGSVVDQEVPIFANISRTDHVDALIFFSEGREFDKFEWEVTSVQFAK